jgi:hypothetical protein
MLTAYGTFHRRSRLSTIHPQNVPEDLRPLIPYAEFWGIADDLERERLVRAASSDALVNLVAVIRAHDNALDRWLAGPEAQSAQPSDEYVAFSAMRMAADFAQA